ncbi:hypothetical protein BC829DRAFT_395142 [Chytridium lagenaria]|nr:hypothetical protein BC829DRAFT_395142 [Chytridium lagenaria]
MTTSSMAEPDFYGGTFDEFRYTQHPPKTGVEQDYMHFISTVLNKHEIAHEFDDAYLEFMAKYRHFPLDHGGSFWALAPHASFASDDAVDNEILLSPYHVFVDRNALFGDRRLEYPKKSRRDISEQFFIDDNGKASVSSYINNLHPQKHATLYASIAQRCLGALPKVYEHVRYVYMGYAIITQFTLGRKMRLQARGLWLEGDFEYKAFHRVESEKLKKRGGLVERDFDFIVESWGKEVPTRSLRGRNLQVIVKAASIYLTPDSPETKAGGWHLEGTDNECIVATAVYYYSIDNIIESNIVFREVFVQEDLNEYYEDERDDVESSFDIKNEESDAVQDSGYAESIEGRCVVFANSNQHKVPSFKLGDKTRGGHRKMLVEGYRWRLRKEWWNLRGRHGRKRRIKRWRRR